MPSLVNRLVVQELAREIQGAEGLLFLSFGGLTVKQTEALRAKLVPKGVKLRMVRNSLARRVLAERGVEPEGSWEKVLVGNTAIAYGQAEAAIMAARVLTEPDVKKAGQVEIRAGFLEGRLLGADEARSLANIPDRKTLNAQILGLISGPARGLVGVLVGLPGGLVRIADARARKLEADGGAPVA